MLPQTINQTTTLTFAYINLSEKPFLLDIKQRLFSYHNKKLLICLITSTYNVVHDRQTYNFIISIKYDILEERVFIYFSIK